MKKKIILSVDIITIILLVMQLQSTIALVIENYEYLHNYQFLSFFAYYHLFGVSNTLVKSPFAEAYIKIIHIVFLLNFYVIVIKLKDLYKKQLINKIYRVFILFNIAFVILKVLEFYNYLDALMHA